MIWLDPASPSVRSAVESGGWGRAPHTDHGHPVPTLPTIDTIGDALQRASETLSYLTGFAIHPAGTAEETFRARPRATRLTPSFVPVRELMTVSGGVVPGLLVPDDISAWSVLGNDIIREDIYLDRWERPWVTWCSRPWTSETIEVQYNFGSTITASARAAVITLAHDIWLDSQECSECGLPERTTAVTREGISYQMGGNQDALGRLTSGTGLVSVDQWLMTVNPHSATRRAAVYTPDAPPPVTRRVRGARPVFAWDGVAT